MGRHKKTAAGSAYLPKKIQSLDGAADILAEHDILWEAVLKRLNRVSRTYGFSRLETPLVEDVHLYESFYQNHQAEAAGLLKTEASGRPAALRPSLLPSVLRCYYQHKIFEKQPVAKWYYAGWTNRLDSRSELTSNYEFGFELLGNFSHLAEAQLIGAVWGLLQSLGLTSIVLEINNIGQEACQRSYQDSLKDYLSGKKYQLVRCLQ